MELRELAFDDVLTIDDVRLRRDHNRRSPDWSDFFSRSGNRAWGAFLDGKLIGTVFLQPDPRHPTHMILSGLWVDPAHRGRGYGHELMDEAISFADAECYRMIKLWVSESNAAAADLYRSMDFVSTGRLRASAHDPFQHLQQLVLDLRQPSALRA